MRSRTSIVLALTVASCGTDAEPRAPFDAMPNVATTDSATATTTDGGEPRDAGPMLTVCDLATMHSDLKWIAANVFVPNCTHGACHNANTDIAGLSLEVDQVYANLVGRASTTQSGWTRVVAGNPDASYVMVALGAAVGPPPQDGTMPLGQPRLCAEELTALQRWITAGAQP